MWASRFFITLGLLALVIILAGAWIIFSTPLVVKPEVRPEDLRVFESGNFTYIPVHLQGTLEENRSVISANFFLWEETHPDREIVSFQVD